MTVTPNAQAPSAATSTEPADASHAMRLNVLASGSGGNCSLLTIGTGLRKRAVLIDAGLSPRRTRRLMAEARVRPDQLDHILITHFDRDHCHPGWASADLARTQVHFHAAHGSPARRILRNREQLRPFHEAFNIGSAEVTPIRLAHDDEGVTAFRIDTPRASLGYATDLGRPTPELVAACKGVGMLAIESNYCPQMQLDSDRPAFLKSRIMDGRGHISNQQAADAAKAIRPATDIVLLHLSQQCNTPKLAREAHAPLGKTVTVTDQVEPTGWLTVSPAATPVQPMLF